MNENFQDKHYDLIYGPVTLTALQALQNIGVQLDKDADFLWESIALQYTGNGGNLGTPFEMQFADSSGYQLSDGLMGNFAFADATGLGVPYYFTSGPFFFPAGSAIIITALKNKVNATNGPFQFIFSGRKRFYGGQG